ncbi:hypothetical protein B0H63DRAFT_46197 [Podospora didyma]|uniref:Homeobox domain-containing protein n=1 Tax=Podospora didyma TaxID=330526 RepID=A0AAE0P6Z1_9PEZI|nr:hypothetical protein B0H63DRAFT_46197 [Podospora didyma]
MEQPQAASPSPPSSSPSPSLSHSADTADEHQPSSPTSHGGLPTAHEYSNPLLLRDEPLSQSLESERHPKGKRKRTAAKDKAILEAAYVANPKPDKAARLDIVKRVSLNEKEVQIWFQNRRQNDRRKSRPLSPQEIAALRYGGMQILSSDSMPYNSSFSTENSETSPIQNVPKREERASSSVLRSDHVGASTCDEEQDKFENLSQVQPLEEVHSSQQEAVTPTHKQRPADESHQLLSRSFSASVGYLSNRWNLAGSFSSPSTFSHGPDDSFKLESFAVSTSSSSSLNGPVLPPPGPQPSQLRLSLSLEGKAEVVPAALSPPRPTSRPLTSDDVNTQPIGPVRQSSLHRSHSASPSITLPPISVLTNSLPTSGIAMPLPPRLTRGRSRDVHAWEFCCDAENREDALTVQAKHESSGSALAAISLLRSTSSSASCSPLQPSISAKRNAPMSKVAPRSGLAKKPKLARAASSVARLQTSFGAGERKEAEKDVFNSLDKVKATMLLSPSGNDSDKENWSPDLEGNTEGDTRYPFELPTPTGVSGGRRPLPSGASWLEKKSPRRVQGRYLQERRAPSFLGSRANTAPAHGRGQRGGQRGQSPLEIFEDFEEDNALAAPAVDDEVERFMRGAVSPSKKGDVDAVAGLLSLSQGNWR